MRINREIVDKFSEWDTPDKMQEIRVSVERIEWLHEVAFGDPQVRNGFLMTFGKHVRQNRQFRFKTIPLLGAAKGCGHNNHQGQRRGEVHWEKIVERMSTKQFLDLFGLEKEDQVQPIIARFQDGLQYLGYCLRQRKRIGF